MKKIIALIFASLISACAGFVEKQSPVCDGVSLIAGKETSVQIYGIRTIANQTQYKAGYPFNWQWVGKNNFTRTTCEK